MKLIITQQDLGHWAAEYVLKTQKAVSHSPFVLGLPTGGTVEGMYAQLRRLYQENKISFRHIITFNMDEYVGLPPSHQQSYHFYMNHHLFSHVDIAQDQIHILNGLTDNPTEECRCYEEKIVQAGGIDLFIGGVGRNGHIAFNEPGSAFDSRTRLVELTEDTQKANARFFENDIHAVPKQALTVGIGTVLAAKELLFLACGASKADAVAQLIQGDISPKCPLTALRTHPCATLIIDEAAAQKLPLKHQEEWHDFSRKYPQADWVLSL